MIAELPVTVIDPVLMSSRDDYAGCPLRVLKAG